MLFDGRQENKGVVEKLHNRSPPFLRLLSGNDVGLYR